MRNESHIFCLLEQKFLCDRGSLDQSKIQSFRVEHEICQEYIEFFLSDEIAGPDGPLAEYGLVSDSELVATQEMVAEIN